MSKKYPLISIIVSNYNGAKLNILQECLRHFTKIDYPNYELLLIDNASTDDSPKIAKKILGKDLRFKLIENDVNLYSKGVNLGFKASRGEYIALFNNDVEIEKGYLQKLLTAFGKYKNLAIAQGKFMWHFDHSIVDSAGEAIDVYGNPVTLGYRSKDTGLFDKEEEILSASGAACLIKKSVLDEVGIYDDNFGIGYEDMDMSLRLRSRGYITMRIPSAVCYHKRGTTDLSPMVRVKVRWHFNKNRIATMIRNYPTKLLIQTLPVTVLIYLGNMFWEISALRNIPLGLTRPKSLMWVFTHLQYLLKERLKIRKFATDKSDRKMLKLFAKSDLPGKMKAVILDKFTGKKQ